MLDPKPTMVVDTNVVLNRWLFQDAATIALLGTLTLSHRWVGTPWMLAEAMRVAAAPHLSKYRRGDFSTNLQALSQAYTAHVEMLVVDCVSPLRCRDPDDQVFLNLAAKTESRLLLTLDRDLLKLRKRAAVLGLQIVEPLKYKP